jgi:hypothetical protein
MGRAFMRSIAVVAALVVGVVVLASVVPGFPDLNPFDTETKDRSQPAVLRSIERLTEYRAASANLEVIVDVEEDGILPSFLQGEKTLLVAAGTVDASVDFRGLGRRGLEVSEDRRAVTITLPRAQLQEARVDLDRSRVFDRDRGLLNRIGSVFQDNPSNERELLLLAERKLQTAAAADRGVLEAAERNTKAMLESLMRGLGFERVTVRFEGADPAAGT